MSGFAVLFAVLLIGALVTAQDADDVDSTETATTAEARTTDDSFDSRVTLNPGARATDDCFDSRVTLNPGALATDDSFDSQTPNPGARTTAKQSILEAAETMALITPSSFLDTLLITALGIAAIYVSFRIKFRYWKNRKVPIPGVPNVPFGHFYGVTFTKSLVLLATDLYNAMPKEKFFGAYFMARAVFIVRDLDLLKTILVKEFTSFHDRGFRPDIDREPLNGHLFLLNGQEWRNLRIKLTPTFTTGKMRMMFPTLVDVGKELKNHLKKCAKDQETEVKEVLARFTTDVISSCVFGIETNSLKNPEAEFRKMGFEITHPSFKQTLTALMIFLIPKSAHYLPTRIVPEHIANFFIGVVRDTMNYRAKNQVHRNDFLQLLMQLKDLGYIPDADNPVKEDDQSSHQKFTLEQATAQAFLFFVAGFETSSATMQFVLYELAVNQKLQAKVQDEVDRVMAKHGGEFTYDALQEMDLLNRVVLETLRKYPVAAIIIRENNIEYRIPGTEVILEKGTNVWFPIYAIHHDPKHWPDPEKFDPDRFLPEEKAKRSHYAYIPFGEGPRTCIGNRFALMQTRAGVAIIMSSFTVSPCKKTPIPMVFDPSTDLLMPKGLMYLKINHRVR